MKKPAGLTVIIFLLSVSSVFAIQEKDLTGLGASKKVHAELITPDGKGPFPAVLILHNGRGVQKYDIAYAERLAKEGYACLIPYYFDAYHISYDTRNRAKTVYAEKILDDFTAEIKYLRGLPEINKEKIAAIGFSAGGSWALILAGMEKIQAGVSYYGALRDGAMDPEIRYHFEDIFTKHSSPVLLLHGEEDLTVNVKYVWQFIDMLKEKFSAYEVHTYPNAGHRFDRGEHLYPPAANDSWNRTLAFLNKYLH